MQEQPATTRPLPVDQHHNMQILTGILLAATAVQAHCIVFVPYGHHN